MSLATKFAIASLIITIATTITASRLNCELWMILVMSAFILVMIVSVIRNVMEDCEEDTSPIYISDEQEHQIQAMECSIFVKDEMDLKRERAFDIIKSKQVSTALLCDCQSVEQYNEVVPTQRQLDEQEFLFLKEMLM